MWVTYASGCRYIIIINIILPQSLHPITINPGLLLDTIGFPFSSIWIWLEKIAKEAVRERPGRFSPLRLPPVVSLYNILILLGTLYSRRVAAGWTADEWIPRALYTADHTIVTPAHRLLLPMSYLFLFLNIVSHTRKRSR